MKLKLSLSGLAVLLLVACEPEFSKDIGGNVEIAPKLKWKVSTYFTNTFMRANAHAIFSDSSVYCADFSQGTTSIYNISRDEGSYNYLPEFEPSVVLNPENFSLHDSAIVVTSVEFTTGVVSGYDIRTEEFGFEHTFTNSQVSLKAQGDSSIVFYGLSGNLHWDWIDTHTWQVQTIGSIAPIRLGSGFVQLNDIQFRSTGQGEMTYLLYTDEYAGSLTAYDAQSDSIHWQTVVDSTKGQQMNISFVSGVICITAGRRVSGIDPDDGSILWSFTIRTPFSECQISTQYPVDFIFVHDGDYFLKRPCNTFMRIEPTNGSILYEVSSIHRVLPTNFTLTSSQVIVTDVYGKVGVHDLATGQLNQRSIFLREFEDGPKGPLTFDFERDEMIFKTSRHFVCTAIPDLIQP